MSDSILDDLCLKWYQIKHLSSAQCFKLLVSEAWLSDLRSSTLDHGRIAEYVKDLPSEIECKLLLGPSNTVSDSSLTRILVTCVPRAGRVKRTAYPTTEYINIGSSLGNLMTFIQHDLVESDKQGTYFVPVKSPNTFSKEVFEKLVEALYGSRLTHSNSVSYLGSRVTDTCFYMCYHHHPYTLKDVICYTPSLLSGTHRPLFVIYQLIHYLRWLHSHGVTHDNITTSSIYTDESIWVKVGGVRYGLEEKQHQSHDHETTQHNISRSTKQQPDLSTTTLTNSVCTKPCPPVKPPLIEYPHKKKTCKDSLLNAVGAWMKGYMSTLDYLLALNKYSGHVYGDPNLHPIVPWVMNFSSCYGGWRDLTKSKFRLNKGDHHLDSTYKLHGFGKISTPSWMRPRRSFYEEDNESPVTPHHLIDTLSEITYFSYYARRTPKHLLCRFVRSNWEPHEYPHSMEDLYRWSPDECIPEFYTDTSIFKSIHPDLPDLALPVWCNSSSDFIKKHRDVLEGDYISSKLHLWIDLVFGDKLFGHLAVSNKNVYKEFVDNHKKVTNKGARQLFQFPHPKRLFTTPPIPHFPVSKHQMLCPEVEVCEEPDYGEESGEEDSQQRSNPCTGGTKDLAYSNARYQATDNASIKQVIFSKANRNRNMKIENTPTAVDTVHDVLCSAIKIPKCNEILCSRIRYLTQFFSSLGGTIWVDDSVQNLEVSNNKDCASFETRKRKDLQGVGCVLIEMLCSLHLPNYEYTNWEQYLQDCKYLWKKCRDEIFPYYNDVIDKLLNSDDVMCTTEYIIHQHCTVLPTPAYFPALYNLIYSLNQCPDNERRISTSASYLNNHPEIFEELGYSGMSILLSSLHPLFYGNSACKAFIKLFHVLAQHCNKKSLWEFGKALEHFYNTSKSMSDKMLLADINFIMSVKSHFGLKYYLSKFVGFLIEDVSDTEYTTTLHTDTQTTSRAIQPSMLGMESYRALKQLLPSLGPMLTAKYITSKLLQVLVGCHVYNEEMGVRYGGEELIMKFLVDISLVYGEAFIDTQYIPWVFNMVKNAMFRMTHKNEGKLLAALNVLHASIKCLDGPTLQNMLEDLQMFVFEPTMRLLTSTRMMFPHNGLGRVVLCWSLSELLIKIVKHVLNYTQNQETGKSLILPLVKQYFTMFGSVSHLYTAEDVTLLADHISPAQSAGKSPEEDYFRHLKQQFPSFPKRYNSQSLSCKEEIDTSHVLTNYVDSSPVSVLGAGAQSLVETLQSDLEDIVLQDDVSIKMDSESGSEPEEAEDDDNSDLSDIQQNCISLMPQRIGTSSQIDNSEHLSMIETDTDRDSSSVGFDGKVLRSNPTRSATSSMSMSSESESEPTLPEADDADLTVDCLSDTSKKDQAILRQIEETLTPEVAQKTYVQLCRLIGQETLRRTLDNIDLIEKLAYMDITHDLSSNENTSQKKTRYLSDHANSPPYCSPCPFLKYRSFEESDTLKDNWRRIWEDSVTSLSDNFNFRHIYLQQYKGHTDRITSLHVMEDECFMLSGSKDKSVLLWDTRPSSSGNVTRIKRFEEHARPVLGLSYLEYCYTCVSMDNQQINCTNLEYNKVITKYESKNGLVLADLSKNSNRIIQGSGDSTLRIFDIRVGESPVIEWRVATSLRSIHSIKALECSDVWVAAGFSSGSINVLDLRVGLVLQAFRPHHQDVTKIMSSLSGEVYTSSTDHSVCYWKRTKSFTEGHQADYRFMGAKEPVLGMSLVEEDLVTCSSARINTFCSNSKNSSTRMRADMIRGGISAMTALPMNKLLVLGCDSGSIKLFS